MSDPHGKFRSMVAAYLADLLTPDEVAWMDSHSQECAACAELLQRVRTRLPELATEAQHLPVSMLEHWVHSHEEFTPLERQLVEHHLRRCEQCRAEVTEMAKLAGKSLVSPMGAKRVTPRRRALTSAVAIAAGLVAVFAVRFAYLRSASAPTPPIRSAPAPGPPGTAAQRPAPLLIALQEPLRGSAAETVVRVMLPAPEADLELQVPRLFLNQNEGVAVRLIGVDGAVLWTGVQDATALEKPLRPPVPPAGWSPGLYRLEVVPGAGADTAAKRVYSFKLEVKK
jgi:hypothetical protein